MERAGKVAQGLKRNGTEICQSLRIGSFSPSQPLRNPRYASRDDSSDPLEQKLKARYYRKEFNIISHGRYRHFFLFSCPSMIIYLVAIECSQSWDPVLSHRMVNNSLTVPCRIFGRRSLWVHFMEHEIPYGSFIFCTEKSLGELVWPN